MPINMTSEIGYEDQMGKLVGKVVSGIGDFSKWIEKLSDHYEKKTGLWLFPGTLNLQLDSPFRLPSQRLRLEGYEYNGTVNVNIVPCKIFGRKAVILRTDENEAGTGHHPLTIVEIATDVKLRDKYNLKDGDQVEVELDF